VKKKSIRARALLIVVLAAVAALSALIGAIAFSPYGRHAGFPFPLMKTTVEINASPDSVFLYLGDSDNARRWSVFVDHINTLNPDSVPDGKVGSWRRAFCNADETGRRWDELVSEVVPGKKRQLELSNYHDFPVAAERMATDQIYEELEGGRCRLTFTVFFKGEPSFRDTFLMYLAAYRIKAIFVANMNNIKRIVETGK
jgi:uncharacterized protein YndB with AHSA1/START domain